MSALRQLFYLSRADDTLSPDEVQRILHISQRNNRQRDITGCLLYSGRHFAQVLEGRPETLDELVVRIGNDPRHHSLVVVMDLRVGVRRFPDWAMGILYKSDTSDRIEQLLVEGDPPEDAVQALFDEVNPDTVMGPLY